MNLTTYTPEELFCLFARGFHFCFCLYTTMYFTFVKKEKATFSYFFALCGVMLTLSVGIGTLARFNDIEWLTVEIDGIFDLSIVPAFAVFGFSLTRQSTTWQKLLTAWFLMETPVFLCAIWYILLHSDILILVALIYITIIMIISLTWGIMQINRYNALLKDSYSNIDNKTLTWFKYILGAMIGFIVAYFVIGKMFNLECSPTLQPIYFIGTEAMVLIIAYFVNKQENVDNDIMYDTDNSDIEEEDSRDTKIQDNLKAFEEQKLYLKQNITIKDLAIMLNSNSKYVSKYLNNTLGKNFNQYINELRLREACEIMKNDEYISLDNLASAVGFSSKATFWRIFQIEYNYSPTQYRDMIAEDSHDSAMNTTPDNTNSQAGSHSTDFSVLSPREKKLCRLIIEGADTQQQCKTLGIQQSSLRVMRSRLRKRLQLGSKDNLRDYLVLHKDFLTFIR